MDEIQGALSGRQKKDFLFNLYTWWSDIVGSFYL